jgi:hypothetical protein
MRTGPKSFDIRSSELQDGVRGVSACSQSIGSSPAVHVLHAHNDIPSIVEEGTVKGHYIRRVAVMHDMQLAHNLLPHLSLGIDVDDLFSKVRHMQRYARGVSQSTFGGTRNLPSWP